MTDDLALQKQLHSWPFSSLSSFRLRFIHFLIPRPFSTHSAVAMATPAAGDYSRYLLNPSLINASLSHFRNDALWRALRNAGGTPIMSICVSYTYIYFIICKNMLFLYYFFLFINLTDTRCTKYTRIYNVIKGNECNKISVRQLLKYFQCLVKV